MKVKNSRLEAIKMLISSMELGSQEEVLQALEKEGFRLTQATLSRDLKQLKVAKAASMSGKYVYVLPNDTMFIKTRPGYASSIAYNIDSSNSTNIIGTIAGDDTILIVIKEGVNTQDVINELGNVIPNIRG